MIYAIGQGNKKEMVLVEREMREQTAFCTDEQLHFVGLYTREDLEKFLSDERQADVICADITVFQGIQQAEALRKKYAKVPLILIADMTISPVSYMKPTILAAALLLKPLQETMVHQVIKEIFQCYIQQEAEEDVFIIETREEKQRIPYSQIMYFEARSNNA